MVLNEPGTERRLVAIARMNWLHPLYRGNGRMRDDDMLYTLSLFALEAIRWTLDLEWRQLTDLERCAMGVWWKNLGNAMYKSCDRLPSSQKGWTNALEWMNELGPMRFEGKGKEKMSAAREAIAKVQKCPVHVRR